jgi:hypothetical protein
MNYIKKSHKVGVFFILLFAICFAWSFIYPVANSLHIDMFRMSFIGFQDANLIGFILGAVQVYVWAYIGVALWSVSHREVVYKNHAVRLQKTK